MNFNNVNKIQYTCRLYFDSYNHKQTIYFFFKFGKYMNFVIAFICFSFA